MKRKQILNILIIAFVSILIFCTYFSKTIKNMMLPSVTIVNPNPSTIGNNFETEGTVNYGNTHKIYVASNWTVKEISVKVNQTVKKGDILGKVDNNLIISEEQEEQLIIMKLENELKILKVDTNIDKNKISENKNKIMEDEYSLNIERLKYKQIRNGLTQNGGIISDINGEIVTINSQNIATTESSNALFELVDNNPTFLVAFDCTLKDAKRFSVGSTVNVFVNTGENDNIEKKVTAQISQKNYDAEEDKYVLYADVKETSNLKSGDKVSISSISETKRYDNVIPKSCLSQEQNSDYIFVVNRRTGALGEEEYVRKIQVQVTAFDDENCAIKATEGDTFSKKYGIVMSSSKPIDNNSEVRLDYEK